MKSRNLWRLTIQILGLMVIVFNTLAQRTVTGRVVDASTGKPVRIAMVRIEGTDSTRTTNALGYFRFVVDSTTRLIVTSPEYESVKIKVPLETNDFVVGLTELKLQKDSLDSTHVSTNTEVPADFPGGFVKFVEYLGKNIKYPRDGINGQVTLQFVIDRTGSIPAEQIKIIKSLSPSCDAEAIRLIKNSPKWIPGMQNGKAIISRFTMPIRFKRS